MGGLVTGTCAKLLGADGPGGAAFVAALAGVLVLAGISTAMGAFTVMLRDGLTHRDLLGIVVGQVGRLTALEVALAVILAFAYALVGWWTPLAIGGFVLIIWGPQTRIPADTLTGLPSREGAGQLIDRGLGRVRLGVVVGATVMVADLEGLELVNDRYGSARGDEVLREVAGFLRDGARRRDDVVGRMGGLEFVLYLPGLANESTAVGRAIEIGAAIHAPMRGIPPDAVGVSIGVRVLQRGEPIPDRATLLREAEQAMHVAKRNGGIHLFDAHHCPLA